MEIIGDFYRKLQGYMGTDKPTYSKSWMDLDLI